MKTRRLDKTMFEHPMNCVRLRMQHGIEPHEFFMNGSEIFRTLTEMENAWGE